MPFMRPQHSPARCRYFRAQSHVPAKPPLRRHESSLLSASFSSFWHSCLRLLKSGFSLRPAFTVRVPDRVTLRWPYSKRACPSCTASVSSPLSTKR